MISASRLARVTFVCMVALAGVTARAVSPTARAWLDRDTMQMGETVTLNVQTGDTTATAPDFSALAQDFTLLTTQSSQQVNIVNGARSATMLWAIGLEPRHTGHITIAPIKVGLAQTAPIELNVLAASVKASSKAGDDVFIEFTADPLTPYVQQEVRCTVKLYYAFDLTNGSLGEPHAEGLGVHRVGQDKSYVASVGERRYHVVERHYALTPEHSGGIDIAPLAFRGTALDGADPTGFFSRGRDVAAHSDAIHLEVKPKPAQWNGSAWLPAAALLLKDETPLPDEVHVGDPVTRTIRMQAQGLAFEQLPELELVAPDGAQMYPDKPDTRTRDDGEWTYGERVRKFAFVPDRVGTLTIPGLSVAWWDTVHDRAQTAQLPPHTIRVLPAAGVGASPPAPANTPAPPIPASGATPVRSADVPASLPLSSGALRRLRLWRTLAFAGFALWLITMGAWVWRARRDARRATTKDHAALDSSAQRALFLRACSLGDLAGAERALLAWARNEQPQVRNLGELMAQLGDPTQRDALAALQRARYAGESPEGIATRLQNAFRRALAWRAAVAHATSVPALPPLYPRRD